MASSTRSVSISKSVPSVGRVGVQNQGPVGPREAIWVLRGPRAMREDLYRGATFAVGVAEAVGARVAAAEDDDVLVLRGDLDLRVRREPGHPPVLLHEVVHSQVNATELAARYVEVATLQGADGQHDRIVLGLELLCRRVLTNVGVRAELDAL